MRIYCHSTGRLMNGIAQMKQIVSSRVTNSQNNVDWNAHITNIVNTATGNYFVYYLLSSKVIYNRLLNKLLIGLWV